MRIRAFTAGLRGPWNEHGGSKELIDKFAKYPLSNHEVELSSDLNSLRESIGYPFLQARISIPLNPFNNSVSWLTCDRMFVRKMFLTQII